MPSAFATSQPSAVRPSPFLHKRLMFLASIALSTAAAMRLPGLNTLPPPVTVFAPALLLVPLVLHDLPTRKRVLPVTACGILLDVGCRLLAVALADTNVPGELARWIAGA